MLNLQDVCFVRVYVAISLTKLVIDIDDYANCTIMLAVIRQIL